MRPNERDRGHSGGDPRSNVRSGLLSVSVLAWPLLHLQIDCMGLPAIDLLGLVSETLIDLGFLAFLLKVGLHEGQCVSALFGTDRASTLAGIVALDLSIMSHGTSFSIAPAAGRDRLSAGLEAQRKEERVNWALGTVDHDW